MKTAMQELIDWLDATIETLDNTGDFAAGLVVARFKANKSLEKEKEQIIDAFDYGHYCASNGTSAEITLDGKMHYNQTYNQKK